MKEKMKAAYEKLALDYEKHVDTASGHNAYYERPAMMELIPPDLTACAVFDAGCAAGWYTEQLLNRGATVTAMDFSSAMAEACQRRVGGRANVLVGDLAEKLPFSDASFDWIVSSLTLHYIADWAPTFQEFHRILKPGGQLLFSVHHPFMDVVQFDRPDYFALELLHEVWNKQEAGPVEMTFYRRPMQDIVNAVTAHLILEQLVEPQPTEAYRDRPEAARWYAKWFDHLSKRPHFLLVKARKRF